MISTPRFFLDQVANKNYYGVYLSVSLIECTSSEGRDGHSLVDIVVQPFRPRLGTTRIQCTTWRDRALCGPRVLPPRPVK